jgi:hypothetical protein
MAQFPSSDEDAEEGTGLDGRQRARRRAFSIAARGEPLYWRGIYAESPRWQPYLIKGVFPDAIRGSFLHFQFAKRDGTFGSRIHTIDLDDQRIVWRHAPSTLDGLSESTPCAFLFLTKDLKELAPGLHEDGHYLGIRDGGTGGRGQWPNGAGARVEALALKLAEMCTSRQLLNLGREEQELLASLRRHAVANGNRFPSRGGRTVKPMR